MSTLQTAGATWSEAALPIPPMALDVIYSGAYNAAATGKHWLVTKWALNRTVQNSVAVRAEDAKLWPEVSTGFLLGGRARRRCPGSTTARAGQYQSGSRCCPRI